MHPHFFFYQIYDYAAMSLKIYIRRQVRKTYKYVMGLRKQFGLVAYLIRKQIVFFFFKIWKSESSYNAN